jgi:ATP-dependent protease Clp ATPase subunit
MSVAVYNHYKRLHNNLPASTTTKSPQNSSELSNSLIPNFPNQQHRIIQKRKHIFVIFILF